MTAIASGKIDAALIIEERMRQVRSRMTACIRSPITGNLRITESSQALPVPASHRDEPGDDDDDPADQQAHQCLIEVRHAQHHAGR